MKKAELVVVVSDQKGELLFAMPFSLPPPLPQIEKKEHSWSSPLEFVLLSLQEGEMSNWDLGRTSSEFSHTNLLQDCFSYRRPAHLERRKSFNFSFGAI